MRAPPYVTIARASEIVGLGARRLRRMCAASEIDGAFSIEVGTRRVWLIPSGWCGAERVALAFELAAACLSVERTPAESDREKAA